MGMCYKCWHCDFLTWDEDKKKKHLKANRSHLIIGAAGGVF